MAKVGTLGLLDDIAHFFIIIFAIKDFPFAAAFGNWAFLAFDLASGGGVDFFFLLQPLHNDVNDGEANRVPVLDKIDLLNRGKLFCDVMGEQGNFFAGQTHLTAPTFAREPACF